MSSSIPSDGEPPNRSESDLPDPPGDLSRPQQAIQASDAASFRLWRADPEIAPGLYIVSTPIGNLRDITLRALDVLASVDMVLAEDTRVAQKLMNAYGLAPTLRPYHDHNGEKMRPGVLRSLEQGKRIALISDAGTPLVSDPGFKLVREVVAEGHNVIAIPGASALLTALAGAGLATDKFMFAGFPPPRSSARKRWLETIKNVDATLIFYEGGSRLAESLADMGEVLGQRDAVLARELTKKFEEFKRAPLRQLAQDIAEQGSPRGELVILLGPPIPGDANEADLDSALKDALADMTVKDAAAHVATRLGLKKRDVYNRALKLRDKSGSGDEPS